MKVRTIPMMLTLLVAGLAIGCSTAPLPTYTPYPTYTPVAPVAMLTEKEAIEIARAYYRPDRTLVNETCWEREPPEDQLKNPENYTRRFFDFHHSESASFKPNGLWIVMGKTSYILEIEWPDVNKIVGRKISRDPIDESCLVVVDDATAKVRPD